MSLFQRFKEVKSVETMTDNVLQVCNTCGNAMGVDLIHSRGEVEVIDLADATQPPVTTGARPGNPVARHLNEAQVKVSHVTIISFFGHLSSQNLYCQSTVEGLLTSLGASSSAILSEKK